jgi:hypothetical protein
MKRCRLLVFVAFYVCCCCVAVCQEPQRTPLFGGELGRTRDGDPSLTFSYVQKGKEYSGGQVWLVWFEGEPALELGAKNEHWAASSTAQGHLLICKNRVVFDVIGGWGARGHEKALPQDDIEVPISGVTFKFHDGWGGPSLMVFLSNGSKKRGVNVYGSSRQFYEFLNNEVTRNFDGVIRAIAQAANLKDIDHDLPESAHYHRTGVEELKTYVAQKNQEEKEEKASQGGGGLTALLAIATGAAAGLSGGGNNTPILQTANQQAAAIRAIGDANAAKQQAASQQQALAMQQRTAAQQAAIANSIAASSTPKVPATAHASPQEGSESSANGAVGAAETSGTTPSTANEGGSCTSMNSSVSVTYQWRSGSGGFCNSEVLSFVTNNSSQNVDCALAFHKNGSFDTANASQTTVRPGQTTGGEWGGLWSCGNDTNQVIYSCTTTAQNLSNNCLGHVNWAIQ